MQNLEMIAERLRFLEIDADVLSEIRGARAIVEPVIDEMLGRFYAHILEEPALRALFVDQDAMGRARLAQKNHWLGTLFAGIYDDAYFEKTSRIGRAHARVGLTPNWYIGGYCQMLGQFIELILKECADEGKPAGPLIQAVSKAIFLDIDLVIHCYLDAKDSSMRQVLRRATEFTADASAISDGLNGTASRIGAAAKSLTDNPTDAAQTVAELSALAEQLSDQTTRLDARLKQLQFRDKLYIDECVPASGRIARLKALIFGKK